MKKIKFLTLVLVSGLLFSCEQTPKKKQAKVEKETTIAVTTQSLEIS